MMFANRCRHPANVLLPFHVNGSLSETEEAEVREHVRGCAACDAEIEVLTGLAEVVRAAPLPILDGAPPRRPPGTWAAWGLAAAVAVTLPMVGIWWFAASGGSPDGVPRHGGTPSSPAAVPGGPAGASAGRHAPEPMNAAVYLDLKGGPTRAASATPRLPAGAAEGTVVLALLLPDRPGPADRLELTDPSGRILARSEGPLAVDAFGRVTLVLSGSLLTAPGSYSVVLRRGTDAASKDAATAESPLRFPFAVGDGQSR